MDPATSISGLRTVVTGIRAAGLTVGGDINISNIGVLVGRQAPATGHLEIHVHEGTSLAFNIEDLDNKLYLGHEDYFQKIREWIERSPATVEQNTVGFNTCVLHGMAGVGKTTIVRRLVKNISYQFKNIIWIPAETKQSISASFVDLASRKLNIPLQTSSGEIKNDAAIIDDVYSQLSRSNTLLIFDNAEYYITEIDQTTHQRLGDGIKNFLPKLIPQSHKYPKILITSRNTKWDKLTANTIRVEELPTEVCIEYIENRLRTIVPDVNTNAHFLVEYFGNLIITIESAVDAILLHTNLFADFQDELYTIEKFLKSLRDFEKMDTEQDDDIIEGTYHRLRNLWSSTFHMLETKHESGRLALHILDTMAFLSPSGVPVELISKMYEENTTSAKLLPAINVLKSLSFFAKTQQLKVFRVHRLLQKTRLDRLIRNLQFKTRLQEFSESYNLTLDMISFKRVDNHLYVDNAIHAYQKFKDTLVEFKEINSLLLSIPASLEHFDAQFSLQAYQFLENCLRDKGLPEKNEVRLHLMDNIISLLDFQGKYEESWKLIKRAHDLRLREFTKYHISTASAIAHLSKALLRKGKFDVALMALEQVLEVQNQVLGEAHPDTFTTRHKIAEVFQNLGKYDSAIQAYEAVLATTRKVLGEKHKNTLATQHNIAQVYALQGNFKLALEAYNDVHRKQIELLGNDHPDTLVTKYSMGEVFQAQCNYKQALEYYEDVIRARRKIFRDKHPNTFATKYSIAQIFHLQKKYDLALSTYKEVLEVQEEVLGGDHQITIATKHSIAQVLKEQGKETLATKVYDDVLMMAFESLY